MAWTPNSTYLMTSRPHTQHVGAIHMWANKYLFDPALTAPLMHGVPKEPIEIDRPAAVDQAEFVSADEDEAPAALPKEEIKSSLEPLAPASMTLSSVPHTQWQNLLNLEEIK